MSSETLYAKARALDALANKIEKAMDAASTAASSSLWECPNATDIRSAVAGYRRSATNAATQIRLEAGTVRSQAKTALDHELDEKRKQSGHKQPTK
ncbi:hypothetical protein [Luteipulveratus mongoliensis]|uniref:Uncharacterized protein n=1 Tax=Luteipulveratus mongoliensis TaxID=571913 RepID=A0A0K1JMW0_9MICO|nr:hypothetical protein [Luteipulveratus mongoliensis]AKU18057.1 hypothetical protein VV02_22980 [Luteipulveratus mongoliensis]